MAKNKPTFHCFLCEILTTAESSFSYLPVPSSFLTQMFCQGYFLLLSEGDTFHGGNKKESLEDIFLALLRFKALSFPFSLE